MRISNALLAAMLLTGCSAGGGEQAERKAAGGTDGPERIWCAPAGARDFTQDCVLERSQDQGRPAFVVRHGDGKFRRLIASADGQSLLAADGAEQSQSARKRDERGERWEVILGDDRYVVPVKADAARP